MNSIIPTDQIAGGIFAYLNFLSRNRRMLFSMPPRIPVTASLVATITIWISSWVAMDMTRDAAINNEILTMDEKCQHSTFDYIIVGAGAAGMVVATRVANASRDARVLLLEAGGEPHVLNNLPVCDIYLMDQPANTWMYRTTPQENACGLCRENRAVTTRGKMLGGSTSINFMLYGRGHRYDFDSWAHDANDTQWSYENVLPYFKKSENYNGAYAGDPSSLKYHGQGGLLNVATHDYMPGVEDLLAAAVEKGYKVGDYNGEDQEVFSKIDVTTKNGWRESTYRAFYKDTGRPENLCIKKYAHVTQIQFDFIHGKPRAVGVVYERQLQKRKVRARKEIIISSGTIGSAKLLMLSGVGPADHLKDLGIPLVKDLPVGHNLQDHTYAIVGPFLKGPSLNGLYVLNTRSARELITGGHGSLAAPAGFAGQAFLTSPMAQPSYPDLQVIQFSASLFPGYPTLLSNVLGLDVKKLSTWLYPFTKRNVDARLLMLLLGRPKSVGRLTLASSNPNDAPIIDPMHLKHPDDSEALLYGFKKMVDLFENSSSLNTPIFPKPVPNCENKRFKSDDYYRCVIRQLSGSFYHATGTCALGKVVDHTLRVKGIDGLRVIDASIMPRVPNANTQAATIMIGEKGADLLLSKN